MFDWFDIEGVIRWTFILLLGGGIFIGGCSVGTAVLLKKYFEKHTIEVGVKEKR